jgi:hypothetical protein
MKKTITNLCLITLALACFLLFPVCAIAIPTLGVAPGAPGSGGFYYGPTPDSSSYQWVFADAFVGGVDGFAMPASGGLLSIWFGSNSGSPDPDKDIWIATTAAGGAGFTFDGQSFTLDNNLAVAGYKEDVYGLKLGTLNNPLIGAWEKLEDGEFGTGKKEFYVLTAEIEYSNFVAGDWMYAAITGSPVSDFSPKTTSSTNSVPEPSTMLLFGTGIVGLAGWGRKKFKKNRN